MNEAASGSTVRITNKFDRLFFERIGTITQVSSRMQGDGSLETNYYVQASGMAHGRWFRRGEFELIDEQASVKQ